MQVYYQQPYFCQPPSPVVQEHPAQWSSMPPPSPVANPVSMITSSPVIVAISPVLSASSPPLSGSQVVNQNDSVPGYNTLMDASGNGETWLYYIVIIIPWTVWYCDMWICFVMGCRSVDHEKVRWQYYLVTCDSLNSVTLSFVNNWAVPWDFQ